MKRENLLLEGVGSKGPEAQKKCVSYTSGGLAAAREAKFEVTNQHWNQGSGLDNSVELCSSVFYKVL